MFAQVMQAGSGVGDQPELVRLVRERLIPALEQEEGFSGALGLVEPRTGRAMMIALWDREEQANAPQARRGAAFRTALADVERLSGHTGPPISVWVVEIEL